MPGPISVNEVRIQLDILKNLSVFRCTLPKLSSRHKRLLVMALAQEQNRVSIFEGDVLFSLPTNRIDPEKDKLALWSFINKQKFSLSISSISVVRLRDTPERVIERITFSMISHQAKNRGIFHVFGRTLFQPSLDPRLLSHKAVETSVCIENNFLKLYLNPTYIALSTFSTTQNQGLIDRELVGLCSFRSKISCSLMKPNRTCPYLIPGRLGYFVRDLKFDDIDTSQKEYMQKLFSDCPHFSTFTDCVLVKTTKTANLVSGYPSYLIYSGISKVDLISNPDLREKYRDATLMLSLKRRSQTEEWINLLFSPDQKKIQHWGAIRINDIEIPVEILFSTIHNLDQSSPQGIYKASYIPDQPIVIDSQNPTPRYLSGGWLFSNMGSYDRRDPQRPFTQISPYIIVPNKQELVNSTRQIIDWLSDEKYSGRSKGDKDFWGINCPDSKRKYNLSFVNAFRQEENIYPVDGTPASYLHAIADIKRDWNINSIKDPNKIVIAIIPSKADEESNPLYLDMKKALVEEGIPSQFITFDTLENSQNRAIAFGPVLQSLWLNLYAKLGGKPWRLANQLGNVHCFIGIGFGINPKLSVNHIYAGVAHIFDRFGNWVDIASAGATLSKGDLENFDSPDKYTQGSSSFKISQNVTQNIVYDALKIYQQKQTKTHENAKNIVLHKLGQIYECEVIGFLEGILQILGSLGECHLGILQIEKDHQLRLYGGLETGQKESYTIYRGSSLQFNESKLALATTGRNNRQTNSGINTDYSGIGTPQPLLLTSIIPSVQLLQKYGCRPEQFYDINVLTEHTMALTQLHWGSIKDNVRLPITVLYAKKVADIISKTDAKVDTWLGLHRPWFL